MNDLKSKNDLKSTQDTISRLGSPLAAAPTRMLARLQAVPESQADTTVASVPCRTTHGSCAWSLPSRDGSLALRQPQDGAITSASHSISASMLSALRSRSATSSAQANDDKLSGATRSLASRILGLNGMNPMPKPALNADTERYFAEHSPKLRTESIRKSPDGSRKFTRLPSPQTNVA